MRYAGEAQLETNENPEHLILAGWVHWGFAATSCWESLWALVGT